MVNDPHLPQYSAEGKEQRDRREGRKKEHSKNKWQNSFLKWPDSPEVKEPFRIICKRYTGLEALKFVLSLKNT